MTQPDFVVIPTQLLSDDTLQPADRVLFGYIYWMTKLALMKCVASNTTLGELAGMSERGVRASLERLEERGYIGRIYRGEGKRHREEITCLLAFSAVKPGALPDGTNVPSRRNKRAVTVGTNVPHNKKREEEKLNRKSTNVLVKSPSAPSPTRTYRTLFEELVSELGFSSKVLPTEGRLRKLKTRNRTFRYDQLITAARNLAADPFMQGDNDSGKRYGTIDYFLRSDETVAKYLELGEGGQPITKGAIDETKYL